MTHDPHPAPRRVRSLTLDFNQRGTRIAILVFLLTLAGIVRMISGNESSSEDGNPGNDVFAARPAVVALAPANAVDQQLVIADPHTGTVTPLTNAPYGVLDYAVSPSGNLIAYAQNNADGTADLWLVDLTRGVDQLMTRALTRCVNARCRNPAWNPDERQIAYQREDFLPEPARGLSHPRVWTVDIVTVKTQLLIADPQVLGADSAWSPDGQDLAVYDPARNGVRVYALQGREPEVIVTIDGVLETAGLWSPDGRQLLYPVLVRSARGVEFYTHLELTTIMTAERVPVTGPYDTPIEEGGADWSPDGRTLLVARRYMDDRYTAGKQILRLDLRDGTVETLVADPQFTHAAPQWDASGRWIVYQRYDLVTINTMPEIWVYDTDTGAAQLVIENAFFPGWGP